MAYFKTQEAYFSEELNEVCIDTFENVDNRRLSWRKAIAKNFIDNYSGVDIVSFYERGYSLDETIFARLPEPKPNEIIYVMSYSRGKWSRPHQEKFGENVQLKEQA